MIQYILHALWANSEIFICCEWFFGLRIVLFTSWDSLDFPWKWSFWSHSCFSFLSQSAKLTFREVLYCCERSSCFFSVFLSWCFSLSTEADQATRTVCTNCFQTASVRYRHLSYFTRSASRNPRLDLHPGKSLHLRRFNFPPFWSPIPVFCPVYENCNTAAVFFCRPPLCVTNPPPTNAPTILQVVPVWAPCISPCFKSGTYLELTPLSKELKY